MANVHKAAYKSATNLSKMGYEVIYSTVTFPAEPHLTDTLSCVYVAKKRGRRARWKPLTAEYRQVATKRLRRIAFGLAF